MHVISKEPFDKAVRDFPNDTNAIITTYKLLKEKNFDSPMELQKLFPSLDNFKYRNKWWVIDIGGNNLRMIAYINFTNKRFYVKHIATHKEYDKLTKKYRETKE
ncbi:type II toxin-antitoxin system HigB family toxin [Xenorhabdus bovienii]|uniref:Putative cytoplasmic protein n=1 Tax=Xenorhabdus bovienii str. Intermedium TaxID=1379677 RepID=A0A077QKG6_XENBV|nr:type II toxin-antitoxin system HigB family toxin [Xenorhabdus bovienii]MDE9483461.1 type II toxin-antitoxin system HigB family toxin [Xenorhabdus bovienii]MDE9543634.1 type II toxin-antitoxin system HigB family toxin [Xenorhabdus bovienii]CDH33668.1 putative cytoplasmic protein [Xenorhabdus bovienii str. Intermedium]